MVGFFVLVGLSLGCDGVTLPTPSPTASVLPAPPAGPNLPRVWTISPNTGTTDGTTPVLIHGEGFEPGATVTLDGAATDVSVVSSTAITTITSAHAAASVDVVVTNPGGQSGRLLRGYTYAVVVAGPAPSIAAVSPSIGTVGGGGSIRITGDGFHPGAIVKLDDTALRTYPFGASSTTLNAQASPHTAGTVDVIVINPDGHRARLSAGYTYAAPGTLDFSGQWKGTADDRRDNHGSTEIRFTIANNRLVSISCNSTVMTLSPPPWITNDEFSFSAEDRPLVSGRFLSSDYAVGKIDVPPCGLGWGASKQH